MKLLGVLLLSIGILWFLVAFNLDVTVSNMGYKVNNIGMMDQRRNHLIFSALMVVVGVILFAVGSFKTSLSPDQSAGDTDTNSGTRKCPFCAEFIKMEAIVCRFCQKDLPEIEVNLQNPISSSEPVENFDNLPQSIIKLRREGVSYYLIAEDFNEKNAPIPERYSESEAWSPEIVKLVEHCGKKVSEVTIKSELSAVNNTNAEESATAGLLTDSAWNGNVHALKSILQTTGLDINRPDIDGNTALELARQNGHKEVVEILLAHGAKD